MKESGCEEGEVYFIKVAARMLSSVTWYILSSVETCCVLLKI